MSKLNINNGGVDTNKQMPSIDERYGPYDSIDTANHELGASGRNVITAGLTVGIVQPDKSIKEYFYQPNGSGQLELVPKDGIPEIPEGGTDMVLGVDENGNPVWIPKPADGDDAYHVWLEANRYDEQDHPVSEYIEYNRGKSAKEIYEKEYNEHLTDTEFIAKLKMNYPMLHVGYDEDNAGATVGEPFDGNLGPIGDSIVAGETTMGKLYLMPDAASDPENCIGFVTVLVGQEYKWCNVGAIRIPSDVLAKSDVDNECTNGTVITPASAKVVMDVQAKIGGELMDSVKIVAEEGENGNVVGDKLQLTEDPATTGQIVSNSGSYTYKVFETNIPVGTKSIRFRAFYPKNEDWNSNVFAFGNYEGEEGSEVFVPTRVCKLPWNGKNNTTRDYVVKVEQGETVFRCPCLISYTSNGVTTVYLSLDDFYCYLQKANTIKEELHDELGNTAVWKKNLISQDINDYEQGYVYAWDSSSNTYVYTTTQYGILSNKLYLEDGIKYTASNVNGFKLTNQQIGDACTIYISRFDSNNNYLGTITKTGIITKTNNNANMNTATSTFTYNKHKTNGVVDEAYCRIRLRYNANPASSSNTTASSWKNAQLEIGEEVAEYAPYHSEKMFVTASKGDIEEVKNDISELEAKHDEDIAEINEKFKHETKSLLTANNTYPETAFVLRKKNSEWKDFSHLRKITGSLAAGNNNSTLNLYKVEEGVEYYLEYDVETAYNVVNIGVVFLGGECWNENNEFVGVVHTGINDNYQDPEGTYYVGTAEKNGTNHYLNIETSSGNAIHYVSKQGGDRLSLPDGCTAIAVNARNNSFKLYKKVMEEFNLQNIYEDIVSLKENSQTKQTINILSIGNSASQDALMYVPFLMKGDVNNMGIAPEINLNIGILMLSSATTINHIHNFDNFKNNPNATGTHYETQDGAAQIPPHQTVFMADNGRSYTYQYCYNDDDMWKQDSSLVSIQDVLHGEYPKWDLILLNASDNSRSAFGALFNRLASEVSNDVKFGFISATTRIVTSKGDKEGTDFGIPYPEGNLNAEIGDNTTLWGRWKTGLAGVETAASKTLCTVVLPVQAAICNALTIKEIKELGDYSKHRNNDNYVNGENDSDGCYGYLRAPDGVHLQEGLPCQIAAYAVIQGLFNMLGMDYKSVLGNNVVCDSDWANGKAIKGMQPDKNSGPSYPGNDFTRENVLRYATTGFVENGDSTGIENPTNYHRIRLAQKCAIMACKHPFEITDMNDVDDYYLIRLIKADGSDSDGSVTRDEGNVDRSVTTRMSPDNNGYSCTLDVSEGYHAQTITVTMGAENITNTALSGMNVNIAKVIGDVTIEVKVVKNSQTME